MEKMNYIAAISHEMRTPLAAVLGFAEILEQDDVDPEERKQVVAAILRNGKALLTLVDQIIEKAHLESQRIAAEDKQAPSDLSL